MREESGITAAEYGIILGCIAAVLVTGIVFIFPRNWVTFFQVTGAWFAGGSPTVMLITGDRTSRS